MTTIKEVKKEMVVKALVTHRGNRTKAARELGCCVRTLRNYLREFRIDIPPPAEFGAMYAKGKAIGELNKVESQLVVLSQCLESDKASAVLDTLEHVKVANGFLKGGGNHYVID